MPATKVSTQTTPIVRLALSGGTMGCDHLDAAVAQVGIEFIAVAGAVPDKFLGESVYESGGEGVEDELCLVALTTRSPYGDRKAVAVCHCHDLGRFAASSDSNFKTPFLAPAWVPSMKASVRSSLPRCRRSSASAASNPSSVPSRSHF
jgi:hypothetical protein